MKRNIDEFFFDNNNFRFISFTRILRLISIKSAILNLVYAYPWVYASSSGTELLLIIFYVGVRDYQKVENRCIK
jgi:hypothetical protein